MFTECIQSSFGFVNHFRRQVVARFDGGVIRSDDAGLKTLKIVKIE